VKERLADYNGRTGRAAPKAIFMENHGLIVGGETPDEVRATSDGILAKIGERLRDAPAADGLRPVARLCDEHARALIYTLGPALRGLLSEGDTLKVVTFDDSDVALRIVTSEDGQALATGGPLTPDQIVYCKSFPLWLEPRMDVEEPANLVERLRAAVAAHTEATGFAPKVVLVRGLGLFTAGDDFSSADTVRQVYKDAIKVMAAAERLGGVNPMRKRDREFIDSWEVENYRRQVAAGARKAGRAAGKVAVVTGAAQGFGLGIVQDLANEGAHVALADINADGANQTAGELCSQHGAGRAMGVAMNVTDGASVAEAVHQVVRMYGGFDVFVSNAGVLRAGSVKTQPVPEFEFVTKVNYTGYFVCVQNAAPMMAVQHMAKPGAWSDIIQINSKSGLAGSNRNGAYAGSKFGGIGLTQSFAPELIEDGIKVNAICPGNFFEGPLWSDPENGLFAQYLRTGKVPGARSIEDVKRFYESKVPMGRGCTVPDVMRAVYYLIEQVYETGQALPVTGGQVMLS
jgi:NAD(P)-dependent dehydrogenase (short-subunit alcohol dehydrogenase family)